MPLARCTGCAGFLRLTDWATVKPPSDSSSSLPFLQSVAQLDLARRPQPVDTSHGLSFPSARTGVGDPLITGVPKPATVRVQGLGTLFAAFARRIRAGFVSRRQRSWDSPFGAFSCDAVIGAFPPNRTHVPFVPSVNAPHGAGGRPDGPRLLGFVPRRSPLRPASV
jgi:hypothetical protein